MFDAMPAYVAYERTGSLVVPQNTQSIGVATFRTLQWLAMLQVSTESQTSLMVVPTALG